MNSIFNHGSILFSLAGLIKGAQIKYQVVSFVKQIMKSGLGLRGRKPVCVSLHPQFPQVRHQSRISNNESLAVTAHTHMHMVKNRDIGKCFIRLLVLHYPDFHSRFILRHLRMKTNFRKVQTALSLLPQAFL